jgi:hypothetical protein
LKGGDSRDRKVLLGGGRCECDRGPNVIGLETREVGEYIFGRIASSEAG